MDKFVFVLLASLISSNLLGQTAPSQCAEFPVYQKLDFWVGDWDVFANDELVGHNQIEKVLEGCAIVEDWTATGGGEGKSLFFVDYDGNWRQVWVTQWAMTPGGVKEKMIAADGPPGSVRFQGEIRHPKAGKWLDRTTLSPFENGEVRQLIEISNDAGQTWKSTFDAIYRPAARE